MIYVARENYAETWEVLAWFHEHKNYSEKLNNSVFINNKWTNLIVRTSVRNLFFWIL